MNITIQDIKDLLPGMGVWSLFAMTIVVCAWMSLKGIPIPDDFKYLLGAGTAFFFRTAK